jgi:flagellar motor switch protein FliN
MSEGSELGMGMSESLLSLGSATSGMRMEEAPAATGSNPMLQALLGIDLPVTVSIGRAELPLEQVMALQPGSVLELDRSVDDEVELTVNGRVVAAGHIMMADGGYCIQVTRVVGAPAPTVTAPVAPAAMEVGEVCESKIR